MLRSTCLMLLVTTLAGPALAVLRPEMVQQYSPDERRWFRNQQVPAGPAKGNSCCSDADGTYALEDIRDGHYWTRYHYRLYGEAGFLTEGETDWVPVPDDAVIHAPNRHGAPAVWYRFENGQPLIRCYAPGAGL